MGKRAGKPKTLEIPNEELAKHLVAAATRYRNIITYLNQRPNTIQNLHQKCNLYNEMATRCEQWAGVLSPATTELALEARDRFRNRWR